MSLLLISSQQSLSKSLLQILKHYFPTPSPIAAQYPPVLFINNKYYTCNVHIREFGFQGQVNFQHTNQPKVECVIFLFDKQQELSDVRAKINEWLEWAKVQSVMICLDDKCPQIPSQWKHSEEILQCQAFIPVISESLDTVKNQLPKWIKSGLLKNQSNQNNEKQIFALLDLIETTTWSQLQKKVQKKQQIIENRKEAIINKESEKYFMPEQGVLSRPEEKDVDSDQGYNEQQLQEQMMQFQQLMSQMMQIKQIPVGDAERKKKAESLIMKLAQNIDF